MTVSYEQVFSRFLGKITDYNLALLEDSDLFELECDWLHSACGNARVRRKLKSLLLDDDVAEISFELRNSVDEFADTEWIIEIIGLGMAIAWLQPQVDSIINTAPFIGGKEEKRILNNHEAMVDRLASMKVEQDKLIRDYGYFYNSYIKEG